ncbi:MAG: hypothetical protein KKA81_02240 [Bacteroidetes bacterium]|nr:hypothetical protein [Bacteroidota bacterium]
MKSIILSLKWPAIFLGWVFLAVFLIIAVQYITCPVYIFPEPKPFSGEHWFNPYEGTDSLHWRKSNFQAQSRAWLGITSGRYNTNETIDSIYRSLYYDVIAISDYQKVNDYGAGKDTYIPVYEHGYGVFKNHQVVIGARQVLWRDYPLYQTIHQKQHILEMLRDKGDLVYIAHPKLRGGYKPSDMKYLTGYTGIEVLNYMRVSTEHWDAALSAGKPVTILGNDDVHDIFNPDEVGFRCTYIYSPSLNGDSIIAALRAGRAYGADIYRPTGESMETKREKAAHIPVITHARLYNDTLQVGVIQTASFIRFIGQDGKVLAEVPGAESAKYAVQPEDTYVRTEISYPSGLVLMLNPVFRYDGVDPWKQETIRIDYFRTWVLRVLGFSTLIFIILNIILLRRRFRKKVDAGKTI